MLPDDHPCHDGRVADSTFLAACRGQRPNRLPVWFMRQAGRSLPEYRAAREGVAMLDACLRPELAAELTLQPVRRHRVDAAVLFSDIVVPLRIAGLDVEIVPGRGPVFADPIRTTSQVTALPDPASADFSAIEAAARITCQELGSVPLIAFAGAPFTLASYLVEGGPSRDLLHTKALMFGHPQTWHALAAWTAEVSAQFVLAQVRGGASVMQLFDSWIGSVSAADYRASVAEHSAHILSTVGEVGVPRIHFGLGAGHLMSEMHHAGADVIGVDFRLSLAEVAAQFGHKVPLQGNIDPALLFAPPDVLFERTAAAIAEGQQAPAHIVNLGHGVPPDADPGRLTDLVSFIHSQSFSNTEGSILATEGRVTP